MASTYKDILDKIIFSFSTTHGYETCHYQFYQKKIVGDEGENNAYAEIGKFGHEINELLFKDELSVDDALQKWIEEFDENVNYPISESSKEKKYIAFCDYLANFDESYKDKYDILGVEVELHWKIGKYNCIGYADLILRNKATGEIILVDHKSAGHFLRKNGEPLKNQLENFQAYSKQMYLYSKAIYEKYGTYPTKLVWNHMFEQTTTVIPFNKEDFDSAIDWMKNTIQQIYKDKKFEATKNYMMCYQLCNYRNECEYKKMWQEEEGE